MARIVFAWELGGELGHAMACTMLAHALVARGHEVAFIFRELHQLASLPGFEAFDVYQAPVSPREGRGFGVPDSWSEIMLGCGYHDARELEGLVTGWLTLLGHTRPDLLVADNAPSALLAARIAKIPRVNFANGFAIPPRLDPLPSFRADGSTPPARLADSDARALAAVNTVLQHFGAAPLTRLHEQFEALEDFLCTFPELDHYGNRPRAGYWGPRFSVDLGDTVRWPYGDGARVLVYLRSSLPQMDALIDALAANRCRVAAYVPGLDAARTARLRSARRLVSERPLKLRPLLQECDLLVSHGGNVAPGALMFGVPQLVFPTQYEQFLTGVRLEQIGTAVGLGPGSTAQQVHAAVKHMLANLSRYKTAAQAFRKRYAAFTPEEQQRRIADRIREIVEAR
jgi:UDP:flavonoid glycosyltransferase YjiC (YdhE family)